MCRSSRFFKACSILASSQVSAGIVPGLEFGFTIFAEWQCEMAVTGSIETTIEEKRGRGIAAS